MQHKLVTSVNPPKRRHPKKMRFKNDLNVLRSEFYRATGFPASQTKRPPPWPDLPKRTKESKSRPVTFYCSLAGKRWKNLPFNHLAFNPTIQSNLPFNHLAERGTTCSLAALLNKEAIVSIGNFHLSSLSKDATCVRIYFLFCCC